MKINKITTVSSLACLGFLLLGQLVINAQTKQITERDKSQIIEAILREENFKNSKTWSKNELINTVYILEENISAKQIPQINGIKFVLIKLEEAEKRESNGIGYYEFGEFKVQKNLVNLSLTRTYTNTTNGEIYGVTTNYECRKLSGKWKVKGQLGSAYGS